MPTRFGTGAVVAGAVVTAALPVHAFQIDTALTDDCHERVTLRALDQGGWPDGVSPPAPTETERRIIDDAPFSLPDAFLDGWAVALVIGARHNDVGSFDPFDFAALQTLHDDPEKQPEHCLRQVMHDYEEGDEQALAACRAFILEELELALGTGETVDMDARVTVTTYLKFRGRVDVELAAYPFHLGRALHALQDSYTHSFRNPSDERVLSVLNWIEGNTGDSYDPERDGHAHLSSLDECSSGTDRQRRVDRAAEASGDLMIALSEPAGGRAGRLERAEEVLLAHMIRQPGCTADNDWCDTPEAEPAAACAACAAGGRGGAPGATLLLLAASLLMVRSRRTGRLVIALAVAGAGLASAGRAAHAEDAPEAPEQTEKQKERSLAHEKEVIEEMPDRVRRTWGVAASVGGAFDRAAAAGSAGVRWNPFDTVGFGLDLEYNPWISLSSRDTAPGVASLYAPVIWQIKSFGTWELRTTAYVGATMILFDLVGVDKGTVGAFVGWNPLGLALPLGTSAKFVVKPGDISVPIPQLRGIPFYYLQYRFTVGLEWYP